MGDGGVVLFGQVSVLGVVNGVVVDGAVVDGSAPAVPGSTGPKPVPENAVRPVASVAAARRREYLRLLIAPDFIA